MLPERAAEQLTPAQRVASLPQFKAQHGLVQNPEDLRVLVAYFPFGASSWWVYHPGCLVRCGTGTPARLGEMVLLP